MNDQQRQQSQQRDADRLQRLNDIREQRALRLLEQHRIKVQQAQEHVEKWQAELLKLDRQRDVLAAEAAIAAATLCSINIERMHDARKLDELLAQDRVNLLDELADAEAQLNECQIQLMTCREHWQQHRARSAHMRERIALHMISCTALKGRHHDSD